jgi:hypothetical protein
MSRLPNAALVFAVVFLGVRPTLSQTQEPSSYRYPSTAAPYLEYPLPKLLKTVPELQGLMPAETQEQLPALLAKVGDNIHDAVKKLPNLISHEDVTQTRVCPNALSYGGCLDSERRRGFNYLILSHPNRDTGNLLEEYRTDLKNRPIDPLSQDAPKGRGFASLWVLFSPSSRSESKFRYLGQQKLDKHRTAFVVAFAQQPEAVRFPSEILLQGRSVPVWYQGVAWIDESNFHIVRMRTDLLEPQADIHLQRLTAEIQFGEVRISQIASALLLPLEVVITLELDTEVSKEVHSYSNYRLYAVETRIVP